MWHERSMSEISLSAPPVTRGYGLLEGFLSQQRIKITEKLIPAHCRSGRLLDIGCGSHPAFLLSTKFANKYGIDKVVTSEQSNQLQKEQIQLIQHDSERELTLPFEDEFFDTVTMLAVFEHIEPHLIDQLILEIRRVLKPGGVYILTTPAVWADALLRFMARIKLVSSVEIDDHKDAYTHRRLARMLTNAGFPHKDLRLGYFECFLNIWAMAAK